MTHIDVLFSFRRLGRASFLLCALGFLGASAASAQPTFSKAFSPSTIGPGSVSILTFTIDNSESAATIVGLAFTDNLPAGVTLASPAIPTSDCGGTLTAPDGGSTISLSDGQLGSFSTCNVQVNVTAGMAGTYMNVSGDLTSSAGNSGPASADLTVATNRPGFSKSFSPASGPVGSRSRLTFTIDNTANGNLASSLRFNDILPAGLLVADPANVSNTCVTSPFTGGTVTAVPGSGTVSLSMSNPIDSAAVAAGALCAVGVDVVTTGPGALDNLSGELLGTSGGAFSSGRAAATLTATASEVLLVKELTNDPVPPGGTVDLQFTILNRSRTDPATDITFTDDLDATLSGLVATGLPMNDVCGAGSQISGTSLLTLTGGNLPAEGSCTFTATLQVPAGATPGAYPNTTSAVQWGSGEPFIGNQASDTLFVVNAPLFTKTFLDNPVAAGDSTRLQFTITNTSATSSATDITFTDPLYTFLPYPFSLTLPASGFCGAGSSLLVVPLGVDQYGLLMTGGNLSPAGMAGDSCTFEVTIDLPNDLPSATITNTTSAISATVGGDTVTGAPASAPLQIVGGPRLSKQFTDDPVAPGGTVTLQLTLTQNANTPTDATAISFTDDLNATLSGLTAVGLPMNDICGTGSQISGTTNLSFTGGALAPGTSCQFSVTLQVPMASTAGVYPNTTSTVSSTVSGLPVTTPAASDSLTVAGLSLSKQFTNDPVIPGGQVTLQFTLMNLAGAPAASNISFSDNLAGVVSGLAVDPMSVPTTPCGPSSGIILLSGNTLLLFSGGDLGPGAMCQFSVTVNVDAGVPSGQYGNSTSGFSAVIDGNLLLLQNATDALTVAGDVLALTKTFLTNPAAPGTTLDLQFELTNLSLSGTATSIAFTDDLNAALTGLQAVSLPADGFCGMGSHMTGTGLLSVTGAQLAAGASCTFAVTVQVPAMPGASQAVNTTSDVSGLIGGLAVSGAPATDTLEIQNAGFTKAFDAPTVAGGTAVLTFTIDDLAGGGLDGLSFSDDLNAVLPGLVATNLPLVDVCGIGSSVTGTSLVTLTAGSVTGGGSCSFDVTVQVPAAAMPGSYPNTTSTLYAGGLMVAGPATDSLAIEPAPTFAKAFAPDAIALGDNCALTFTINNTASAIAATALAFTDNLPAGVLVANPSNAMNTCGGTVTAVPDSGVISLSGGTVGAGMSCTINVTVTGTGTGDLVNTTGNLTSSSGDSGTAMNTLSVYPPPTFAKAFSPSAIPLGGVSTLTFTIDNTASGLDATGLGFTDNLPSGMTVADPANAMTDCTGGTLTADPGTAVVSYTGGAVSAGAMCNVSVDVVTNALGSVVNTTEALSSSLGSSGTATGTLTVGASTQQIPTLGQWGLLLLGLGLAFAALRRITLG